MSINKIRAIIGVIILCIVVVSFYSSIRRVNEPPASQFREDVSCLTALCVYDPDYGSNCIEFKPRMAQTIINDAGNRMTVHLKNSCEVYNEQ